MFSLIYRVNVKFLSSKAIFLERALSPGLDFVAYNRSTPTNRFQQTGWVLINYHAGIRTTLRIQFFCCFAYFIDQSGK